MAGKYVRYDIVLSERPCRQLLFPQNLSLSTWEPIIFVIFLLLAVFLWALIKTPFQTDPHTKVACTQNARLTQT